MDGCAPMDFRPETRRISLDTLAKVLGAAFETIYQTLRIQREPPLTRFTVEQLSTSHWFNINAARNDLGYAPTVTMAEGMVRLSQFLARERMSRRRGSRPRCRVESRGER